MSLEGRGSRTGGSGPAEGRCHWRLPPVDPGQHRHGGAEEDDDCSKEETECGEQELPRISSPGLAARQLAPSPAASPASPDLVFCQLPSAFPVGFLQRKMHASILLSFNPDMFW